MKRLVAILVLFIVTANLRADVQLFGWQESREVKTGKRQFGFLLAPRPVREAIEAEAKGDAQPARALKGRPQEEVWTYGILLTGEAKIYQKEMFALFEPSPCGSELTVASGFIAVDRGMGVVRVALKVRQDGKLCDFLGHGVYSIAKPPCQPPGPTPGPKP